MKMSYKTRVREPYFLELSTDELGSIRYLLHEGVEKMRSRVLFFKSMGKTNSEYRKFHKSSQRELVRMEKTLKKLETAIKELKYG